MLVPPDRVEILVEVPRGSFVKRSADRGVEYISPFPSPFTYGCVPALLGGDGDAVDALVLDADAIVGARLTRRVWAVVEFLDDGQDDAKLVCADRPPTEAELARVMRFFRLYGPARGLLNRLRGRRGATGLLSLRKRDVR